MKSGRSLSFASAASASLLIVLFFIFLGGASALSVTVDNVECVYEYVYYEGDSVYGNFIALDHDDLWSTDHPSIDFTVTSADGKTVYNLEGTAGQKFVFEAPTRGMYKFCFHNPLSIPQTVSFYIHVGHIPNEHNIAKDEHLDPVNVKIDRLGEALYSVTAEQNYLKARAARHRHTNESTRRRVIFYTVGEYILLALVSGLQVVYIRRLFSKSVAYDRV